MSKLFAVVVALCLAPAAQAQTSIIAPPAGVFESQVSALIAALAPQNVFAGVNECEILDALPLRPYTLEEARDLASSCLAAVARKYSTRLNVEAGFLEQRDGVPVKPGLIVKVDAAPGSTFHRDLATSLHKRHDSLLGHDVKLLARGQEVSATPSATVQEALSQCILATVVRDIQNGDDFVRIYGRCLIQNPDLKITEIRPGRGLTVTLTTKSASSLNGFVTVNAGKGPVQVMIIAAAAAP